jgi:hypothetical protein
VSSYGPPPARALVSSKPPSNVDTTLSDADHAKLVRRRWTRGIAVVLFCFLAGAGIAAGVAWKTGQLAPVEAPTLDFTALRANEALKREQFTEPPGNNVRDITNEGFRIWPNAPKLVEVRERAAAVLVQQALGRRFSGDVVEALRLAKTARELDPHNASAQHLVETYEAELATPFPTSLPQPTGSAAGGKPPPATSQALAYRVILDASAPRPRLGQPVEFVARISTGAGAAPRGKPESPTLEIQGPGLGGGVKITTLPDAAGAQHATYTFLEAGRYEVVFTTRVDGVSLRASRVVTSGEEARAPATATPTAIPTPTTSGSVTWL